MRLILNIILVIATLLACYVEYCYFTAIPPERARVPLSPFDPKGFLLLTKTRFSAEDAISLFPSMSLCIPIFQERPKTRKEWRG